MGIWNGDLGGVFGDLLAFEVNNGELQVSGRKTDSSTRTRITEANLAEVFSALETSEMVANPSQWEQCPF